MVIHGIWCAGARSTSLQGATAYTVRVVGEGGRSAQMNIRVIVWVGALPNYPALRHKWFVRRGGGISTHTGG